MLPDGSKGSPGRDDALLQQDVPVDGRLARHDDREGLATQLGKLKELQGKETVARWQQWALAGELEPLFAELMSLHYDPHYERSQSRHFAAWGQRRSVQAQALDEAGIEALAREIAAR